MLLLLLTVVVVVEVVTVDIAQVIVEVIVANVTQITADVTTVKFAVNRSVAWLSVVFVGRNVRNYVLEGLHGLASQQLTQVRGQHRSFVTSCGACNC